MRNFILLYAFIERLTVLTLITRSMTALGARPDRITCEANRGFLLGSGQPTDLGCPCFSSARLTRLEGSEIIMKDRKI